MEKQEAINALIQSLIKQGQITEVIEVVKLGTSNQIDVLVQTFINEGLIAPAVEVAKLDCCEANYTRDYVSN